MIVNYNETNGTNVDFYKCVFAIIVKFSDVFGLHFRHPAVYSRDAPYD